MRGKVDTAYEGLVPNESSGRGKENQKGVGKKRSKKLYGRKRGPPGGSNVGGAIKIDADAKKVRAGEKTRTCIL